MDSISTQLSRIRLATVSGAGSYIALETEMRLEAVLGDITKLDVDCVVNAANTSLLGGSGVDGAIHRAAGPELSTFCLRLGGCKPGQAKITSGFKLKARFVIHTVGPYWRGGSHGEDAILRSCYRTALSLATENQIRSIAFPAISAGIYGYPILNASKIAVGEAQEFSQKDPSIDKVVFCCFSQSDLEIYQSLLNS